MSLILEALRKSEAERRRGQVPHLHTERAPAALSSRPTRPAWPWLALAVPLLLAAAWLARSAWSPPPRAAEPSDTVVARPAADTADHADTGANATDGAYRAANGPFEAAAEPPGTAIATLPPPPTARVAALPPHPDESARPDARAPVSMPPAGVITAAPLAGDGSNASIPATTAAAGPATTAAAAPRPSPPPTPAATTVAVLPPPPPAPASTFATPVISAAASSANASPMRLSDLSTAERLELPALKISMHLWDAAPARRFAIIDGARVNEGDRLGDAVVEEITTNAVVLAWRGQRLRLPLR